METMTLEVPVPKDLFMALGLTQAQVVWQLKEFSVFGLYQERKISAGKAAELLDITKPEFVRLLALKGIPYLDYTPEELVIELRSVDGWKQQHDNA